MARYSKKDALNELKDLEFVIMVRTENLLRNRNRNYI